MKKLLLWTIAMLVLTLVAVYSLRVRITERMLPRVIERVIATSLLDDLPDGLHVALCGAGSPLPDPKRSGPCTAVIAGTRIFVVDAGSGASRVLGQLRVPQGDIEAILLTHFHSDHIDGLGELLLQRWANGGRRAPVPLYGPEGVDQIARGLDLAYAQSRAYRVAHHGEDIVPSSGAGASPRPFAQPGAGEARIVLEDGGLRITAFRVDHHPVDPAVGYRFDYAGRSLVISGDTVRSANLEEFAANADLLIHEALSPRLVGILTEATKAAGRDRLAKITTDILTYHTSPVDAAASAQSAGVDYLLFNHIVPPLLLAPMEDLFLEGVAEAYDGPARIGRDGTLVSLPARSEEIAVRELL